MPMRQYFLHQMLWLHRVSNTRPLSRQSAKPNFGQQARGNTTKASCDWTRLHLLEYMTCKSTYNVLCTPSVFAWLSTWVSALGFNILWGIKIFIICNNWTFLTKSTSLLLDLDLVTEFSQCCLPNLPVEIFRDMLLGLSMTALWMHFVVSAK